MKKTLIALAALAATGASFAQVTIYGTIDAALVSQTADGSLSRTKVDSSGMSTAKFGFTGVEDIGGGMKGLFKLEGGVNPDTGTGTASNTLNQAAGGGVVPGCASTAGAPCAATVNASALGVAGTQGLTFNRYAYVGVSGGFGEIHIGREYTGTFITGAATDPFGLAGPANQLYMTQNIGALVAPQATYTSGSNMLTYITPVFAGGLSAVAQVWQGETASNAANSGAGDGYSVSAKFADGPIYVQAGQQVTKGTVAAPSATALQTFGDYTMSDFTATYNFGVAKVVYYYGAEELVGLTGNAAQKAKNTSNLLGVIVPVGAFNFKADYIQSVYNTGAGGKDNVGTQYALGADYALSKRTTAYGTWASVSQDTGANFTAYGAKLSAVAGNSSQAFAIGLRHTF
ncbi:MAG: porin [Burkholderiales bacterium]